jgi:DNA-binding MarR family transcriptional regulator/GNAT superfamily N-acetyltransferase
MEQAIDRFRAFNRVHTRFADVLAPRYMGSEMSVAEARLLYEVAKREPVLAAELQEVLGLDAGYASRVLKRFEQRGWIERKRGAGDARQRPIALKPPGRAAFESLDAETRSHTARRLESLGPAGGPLLARHLDAARALIEQGKAEWTIRPFRTGDMGVIASRQATLYAEAFGWGRPMEVLLGEVTTAFLRGFQPGREQCWVAERSGEMLGSIFLVDGGDGVARLRLLYVEAEARGLGIGAALVRTCLGFARDAGYRKVALWTHTVLASARRIYAAEGFEIVSTETHSEFGDPVQGETWELVLTPDGPPATP